MSFSALFDKSAFLVLTKICEKIIEILARIFLSW